MSTRLYIGNSILKFLNNFNGEIHTVSSLIELNDLLESYTNKNDYLGDFVISDISLVKNLHKSTLISFLEHTKLNIVLLCRYDITYPTLLSRINYIDKGSYIIQSEFNNLINSFKKYSFPEGYISKSDVLSMVQISPILFFTKQYYPKKFRLIQRIYESDS